VSLNLFKSKNSQLYFKYISFVCFDFWEETKRKRFKNKHCAPTYIYLKSSFCSPLKTVALFYSMQLNLHSQELAVPLCDWFKVYPLPLSFSAQHVKRDNLSYVQIALTKRVTSLKLELTSLILYTKCFTVMYTHKFICAIYFIRFDFCARAIQ